MCAASTENGTPKFTKNQKPKTPKPAAFGTSHTSPTLPPTALVDSAPTRQSCCSAAGWRALSEPPGHRISTTRDGSACLSCTGDRYMQQSAATEIICVLCFVFVFVRFHDSIEQALDRCHL